MIKKSAREKRAFQYLLAVLLVVIGTSVTTWSLNFNFTSILIDGKFPQNWLLLTLRDGLLWLPIAILIYLSFPNLRIARALPGLFSAIGLGYILYFLTIYIKTYQNGEIVPVLFPVIITLSFVVAIIVFPLFFRMFQFWRL
ncbi:hypothetical protein N9C75_04290 [Alphaproteobacteria bacterium]|nr:hypothetical protein [Alphaproteobacteria bacterium]